MDEKIVQEMLHELFSSLEALDTQNAAILQFLKDKGIASEQDLAAYLEQAGNASSVRWLAASVRMNHLLSSAIKADEKKAEKEPPKANAADNKSEEKEKESAASKPHAKGKETQQKEIRKDSEATNQAAPKGKGQPEEVETNAGKDTKQEAGDKKDINKNAA
jgi:hypothetical protein